MKRHIIILMVLGILLVTGCTTYPKKAGPEQEFIASRAELGPEKAYHPDWKTGDYWVVRKTEYLADHDGNVYKEDQRYEVVVVENKTRLNATIPYVAKEGDLNLKALYMRQPKTFADLMTSEPEGDNWVNEDVYVLVRYEPFKLMPVLDGQGCAEPMYYKLHFELETHKKEQAYSQRDLALVWDPDMPGRRLKMFHWPLQTGKYWSFPIVNVESEEGKRFVKEKVEAAKKEGYDYEEHDVMGRGAVTEYKEGVFTVEITDLYPFYANYDKKDQTFWWHTDSGFWDWKTGSDLAGIKMEFTETVVDWGHEDELTRNSFGNPEWFRNLTGIVDHRVENPNYPALC
ncbi:TPA: hypothetical protein HA265_06115 [Candidatus Woesearchaeota archaeon]|nr:hypothetical protein [Candidatus Woesearchaeota archaeon]